MILKIDYVLTKNETQHETQAEIKSAKR